MNWNPYFDWCSILLSPKPIPPKQRKTGPKNREFENIIAEIHNMDLDKKCYPQNQWPWTEKLFVMIGFSGPKEYLDNCDVDNLSKAALDAYKRIIYLDDRQIDFLIAFKKSKPIEWIPKNTPSLIIGVKKIVDGFEPNIIPQFFSSSETKNPSPSQIFFQVNRKNFHFEFTEGMTDTDFAMIKKKMLSELEGD